LPPPGWTQTHIAADRSAKTASFARAVRSAKPDHVVVLSAVGAELPSGTGPIQWSSLAEQGFRDVGVPVTILRAVWFMENWTSMLNGAITTGALYYGTNEGLKFPQVATADIGKVAARLLVEGARNERVVEITGPADLSLQDTAAILSKVARKPIQGVSVPSSAVVEAMLKQGASEELANAFGEMVTAYNRGALRFQGTPIRGSVSLEEVFRDQLGNDL
jgi:uncharacterized protein YbjT (DUF2867 family)